MKKVIVFLFLFQLSFGQVNPEESSVEYKDSIVETKKFYIGDVDNDKKEDFVTVIISRNKETNDVIHDVINVKFSNDNFEMGFYPSEAIYITKTKDVNNDGSNEIIIFSKTHEGWWNDISIWTFKNKKWEKVAKTKGFCSDNKDFENRVVITNGKYFLNGEIWDFNEGDIKKVKIKLN